MATILALTPIKDVALDAAVTTRWISCLGVRYLNVHVSNDATDTPLGAWTIEESNDPNADFDPPDPSTVLVEMTTDARVHHIQGDGTVNGAGVWAFELQNPARYVRLVYAPTSGGVGSKCTVYFYGAE